MDSSVFSEEAIFEPEQQRTLRQILDQEQGLPPRQALRILLEICRRSRSGEGLPGDLTSEQILLDREGRIHVAESAFRPRIHRAEVCILGTLLAEMLPATAPSRLRSIVDRAMGRDSRNPYTSAAEFERDIQREQRRQFWKSVAALIGLLASVLLLHAAHSK